jgi:hypothetical protein
MELLRCTFPIEWTLKNEIYFQFIILYVTVIIHSTAYKMKFNKKNFAQRIIQIINLTDFRLSIIHSRAFGTTVHRRLIGSLWADMKVITITEWFY